MVLCWTADTIDDTYYENNNSLMCKNFHQGKNIHLYIDTILLWNDDSVAKYYDNIQQTHKAYPSK